MTRLIYSHPPTPISLLRAWKCDIKGAADGPLKGKRIGIKDTICVAGIPMRDGSFVLEGYVPEIDATGVTKVLEAGTV